jgi:S-adenosylmethionine/arginine decarboxylase-like enzyme
MEDEIKQKFEGGNFWGVETTVDAYTCDPETIRNAGKIKQYVYELCDLIKMKRFGDCQIVNFGADEKVAGYSMIQLIETSLISGHFANKTNSAYINIFSCKYYNPKIVEDFTKEFFKADKCIVNINLRK